MEMRKCKYRHKHEYKFCALYILEILHRDSPIEDRGK